MVDFLISFNEKNSEFKFISEPIFIVEINNGSVILKLWGDPIGVNDLKLSDSTTAKEIIEKVKGHFYYVLWNKDKKEFSIGNSVFSILPLYYSYSPEHIYFSNSPVALAKKVSAKEISKRFILENVLFNYQLFDHSCISGIKLLPTNHCFHIRDGKTEKQELFRIEDHFVSDPKPWKENINELTDQFLTHVQRYFPNESYLVSLTGGFDGRTLAACSHYHKKKFKTFSFGTAHSSDIKIPTEIAKKAGIEYSSLILDKNYISKESFNKGKEFIINSNGCAGFSRAHYAYAVNELKDRSRYWITGNFGSELFRAAHVTGVMISQNLYELFNTQQYNEAITKIENSKEWEALNRNEFEKEWEELKEDIKRLPCFDPEFSRYSKNQRFYIFVFNEVFRKYFGTEMVNQYRSVINRTPFLDLTFIKSLLKTDAAAVYSDFFEHKPIKRFKGQVMYAHIIKKTFPQLGRFATDKGYKPDDLLSTPGKLSILTQFIKKKVKSNPETDNYAVRAAFENNRTLFEEEVSDHPYFNSSFIIEGLKNNYRNRDSFFIALSQLWWLNYLNKEHGFKN